ncbi:ankyrin repeat domain containing protein [Purpureocillium lilacinum]|uniref:Ankyrin repeat domain containing protein n=1 Tax=Purpureocillium lilacinum TaxID=33203 RepID=A0A2U3EG40_PURLI|nr:ankyrin repeat domain containing protein [Purpureocillium lilacinum]
MTLIVDLPPELILVVATHVVSKGDVNDLARSCRALYRILNEYLYNEDDRSGVPTTLAWVLERGRDRAETARKAMAAAAQHPIRFSRRWWARLRDYSRVTPVGCLMMEGAIRDVDARLVLLVAAERGHQRIAELLVEQGVDLNSSPGLCSALQAVTQGGHCGLAKFLAKHGARWREGDPYLEEVTCRAASIGDDAMLRLLLEKGIHLNKSGDRALTRASVRRSGEMMASFVENGAFDSTFARWHYTTAQRECTRLKLMVWDAALRSIGAPNTANTVKLLREYVKDPAISDGGILRLAASLGNAVAVRCLLEICDELNVDETGSFGMTALLRASCICDLQSMKPLLDHGASVHAKCWKGYTALHCTLIRKIVGILPTLAELSLEAIRLLLERGADPNTTIKPAIWGLVPRGNYKAVAELLLEWGAEVDAKCTSDCTDLSIAADFRS